MRQTIPPERYFVAGGFTTCPDYRIPCHYVSRYRHHRRNGPPFSIAATARSIAPTMQEFTDAVPALQGLPCYYPPLRPRPRPKPRRSRARHRPDQVTAPPRTPGEAQNAKIGRYITREYSFLQKIDLQQPTPLKINKMKQNNKPTTDLQRPTHKPTF